VAGASDPGLARHSGAVALGLELPSEPVRLSFAAALRAAPADFPAAPAEQARALLARTAPDNVAALRRHAADSGNSGLAASAAVPLGDIDRLNTVAGRWAAERARAQNRGSTCPSRFSAAAIHGPSARPSGAAHPRASRGSTLAAPGSSAPEFAG
jgi:hypothetical protein